MRLRFLSLILLPLMVSCEQSSKPLEGVQNDIVTNLTSSSWVRTIIEDMPDASTYESFETWIFHRSGKGSHKVSFKYENEKTDERIYYFQWAFTTQNFAVICMDIQESGICYWQINNITPTQLDVISAPDDPVLHPETEKKYLYFHRDISERGQQNAL